MSRPTCDGWYLWREGDRDFWTALHVSSGRMTGPAIHPDEHPGSDDFPGCWHGPLAEGNRSLAEALSDADGKLHRELDWDERSPRPVNFEANP